MVNSNFGTLFKKYRLKSEIETLAEFGELFAAEGVIYDNSLFTRWQRGERIPNDRQTVIALLKLFVKRQGINSVDEANQLLESLQMRDLTIDEIDEIQEIFNTESSLLRKEIFEGILQYISFFIPVKNIVFLKNLFQSRLSSIIINIFVFISLFWLIQKQQNDRYLDDISSIYWILALIGGVFGLKISKKLGFMATDIGKAILMFSLGLFSQVFGQLVYSYYILFTERTIPYPSIGDIGYFGTIPLYILGVIYLANAMGMKIRIYSFKQAINAIVIPIFMLVITYAHLLSHYKFNNLVVLVTLLDFGYPLGQSIYISIAILILTLSRGVFGEMKNKIRFITFALILQYLADYVFIYQATEGIWSPGGVNDYMYFISYLAMSLAILSFDDSLKKLKLK